MKKEFTKPHNPTKKKGYSPKQNKNNYVKPDKYDSTSTLKPIDEVKAFFRDYFRKNAVANHVMSKEAVIKHILKKLTPKEEDVFKDAVNELKQEGFITLQEDGLTLVLTQKGVDSFN